MAKRKKTAAKAVPRLKRSQELDRELDRQATAISAKREIGKLTKDRLDRIESILGSLVTVFPEFEAAVRPEDIVRIYGEDLMGAFVGAACAYCEKCNLCENCNNCQGCYSCQKCQNCNSCQKDCQSCQAQNIVAGFDHEFVVRTQLEMLVNSLATFYTPFYR